MKTSARLSSAIAGWAPANAEVSEDMAARSDVSEGAPAPSPDSEMLAWLNTSVSREASAELAKGATPDELDDVLVRGWSSSASLSDDSDDEVDSAGGMHLPVE